MPGFDDSPDFAVQQFSDTLPEYVLGPNNPLAFHSPDMPSTFFQGVVVS